MTKEMYEMADNYRDAILKRTNLTREELCCPREKSFMTPCVARDGRLAILENGCCSGCGANIQDLLSKEINR